MRRLMTAAVALLALTGTAHAGSGLEFEYSLEQEGEGEARQSNFMRGFDLGHGFRLRITLEQPSFCYLITDDGQGEHRLAFPAAGALPKALGAGGARIPATTFVRFHDRDDVVRFFLVVASERVPELEGGGAEDPHLPPTLALEVRDRYQGPGGVYERKTNKDGVAVKWRAAGDGANVVVEEIALRRRAEL